MEQLAERPVAKRQRPQRKAQPAVTDQAKGAKPNKKDELERFSLYNTTPAHSLASPKGRLLVAKLQAELLADPDKARKFFVSAGILTRTGNLSKRYGG